MNPLYSQFLTAILRHLLTVSAGSWLLKHGILNAAQIEETILAVVAFLIGMGWSLWNKYRSKQEFNMAAGLEAKVSLSEVHQMQSNGMNVSAKTPKGEIPTIRSDFK